MNPKPFSSLNHFTVPVAQGFLPRGRVLRNAGGAKATTTDAGTTSPNRLPGTMDINVAAVSTRSSARSVRARDRGGGRRSSPGARTDTRSTAHGKTSDRGAFAE